MATKKRAKKKPLIEFDRRSKAAKKGWKTRRLRALPKKIRAEHTKINNVRILHGEPKVPNPRIGKKEKGSLAKLRKRLAEEHIARVKAETQLAEEIRLNGFVDSRTPEYLHRDFSIAVHPCRIRHLEESADLRKAMAKARRMGDVHLNRMAHDIAEFYKMPIKEVYTLFWSP